MIKKFRNKFSSSFSAGFTLIELLVVIAIIGILSSVVLASLNTARGKGANAAIKANVNSMRSQAELLYDGAGGSTYTGLCADGSVVKAMESARAAISSSATVDTAYSSVGAATKVSCHVDSSGAGWAISAPLKVAETVGSTTYNYYCADYTGFAGVRVSAISASANTCPAT